MRSIIRQTNEASKDSQSVNLIFLTMEHFHGLRVQYPLLSQYFVRSADVVSDLVLQYVHLTCNASFWCPYQRKIDFYCSTFPHQRDISIVVIVAQEHAPPNTISASISWHDTTWIVSLTATTSAAQLLRWDHLDATNTTLLHHSKSICEIVAKSIPVH